MCGARFATQPSIAITYLLKPTACRAGATVVFQLRWDMDDPKRDPPPTLTSSKAEKARAKWSSNGIQWIRVDLLGASPWNRSGLGVSGYRTHEVVQSIKADGLARRRYRDATVVRVPAKHLAEFRAFNEKMCQGDPLLPAFSGEMKYALLTKHHLVHAVKLFQAGSTFLNGTKELIKPNPHDLQLQGHLEEGVACEVMNAGLWLEDWEAMQAITGEDNFDVATLMGTSEMETLQGTRRLWDESAGEGKTQNDRFRECLEQARARFGTQTFGETDLIHLFNYAVRMPTNLAASLCELHFALIPPSLLRCRPSEFGLVSKLDKTNPYVKLCLIVALYLGAAGDGSKLRHQPGGVAQFCGGIGKSTADLLTKDTEFENKVVSSNSLPDFGPVGLDRETLRHVWYLANRAKRPGVWAPSHPI